MHRKRVSSLLQGILFSALWLGGFTALRPAWTQTTPQDQTTPQNKPKKAKAPAPVKNASESDIQSAKSSGKVWVNTETGVYHKSGKWYGATKQGKFMTEQDAIKAGYRAAKNEK